MNAQEWLARASKSLAERGIESPLIEARALLAHALSIPPTALIAHPETPVPPEADALLQRRLRGEPLAYVLGRKEFAGKEFWLRETCLSRVRRQNLFWRKCSWLLHEAQYA